MYICKYCLTSYIYQNISYDHRYYESVEKKNPEKRQKKKNSGSKWLPIIIKLWKIANYKKKSVPLKIFSI